MADLASLVIKIDASGAVAPLKETEAATEALIKKQDAFLLSMDKQAATLGKGAAALRAYKAEQLGLTGDKTFENLNKQISDLEKSGPSAIDQMATRIEGRMGTMVLRMGVHFALVTLAIGAITGVYHMLTDASTKLAEDQKSAWGSVMDDIQKAIDKADEYNTKIGLSTGAKAGMKAYDWAATVAHGKASDAYASQLQMEKTRGMTGWSDQEEADYQRTLKMKTDYLRQEQEAIDAAGELFRQESLAQSTNDRTAMEHNRDAAAAARLEQQQSWLKALQTEVATWGMNEAALKRYQQAQLGLSGSASANAILNRREAMAADSKYDHSMARGVTMVGELDADTAAGAGLGIGAMGERLQLIDEMLEKRAALRREYSQDQQALKDEAEAEEAALNLVIPGRAEIIKYAETYEKLVAARNAGKVSAEQFSYGEKELLRRTQESIPVMTDMFGNLRDTITSWSKSSTDAFVEFCFTGKSTFTDLINSMLKDLARLAVQKNLMGPLFDYLSAGFNKWNAGGSGGAVSLSGATDPNNFTPVGAASTSGAVAPQITVNITPGGKADVSASNASAQSMDLAKTMQPVLNKWAVDQMRPGGLLAGARA